MFKMLDQQFYQEGVFLIFAFVKASLNENLVIFFMQLLPKLLNLQFNPSLLLEILYIHDPKGTFIRLLVFDVCSFCFAQFHVSYSHYRKFGAIMYLR